MLDTGLDDNYRSHPAFQEINVVAMNYTTPDVSGCPLLLHGVLTL